ncbi:MAG: TetR/AcrR family transcriptional regulator [Jatrophihabitans sp.]
MSSADGPLFDTLFRPTAVILTNASAAPVRVRGTRTRAGNAMSRTRSALLAGAAHAVTVSGTKITMAQVATAAGVAKATLYNHFRTREAVLASLVLDQVQQLVDAQSAKPIELALIDSATGISSHPVLRGLATAEPAALAALGGIDQSAAGWQLAHDAVTRALAAAGRDGADTVTRWLASFVLSPAGSATIAADVAVLLAGLPLVAPAATAPDTLSA